MSRAGASLAEGEIFHDGDGCVGVLDAGIEFLPKPFTSAALLARVRAVLDRA